MTLKSPYFLSNAAVDIVAQAILVISFLDEICTFFRDIGPAWEKSGFWNDIWTSLNSSRSLLFNRS